MQYALIDARNRVHALQDLESRDEWIYPEGFTLIEAPNFVMDYSYEYADYVYQDGEFVLDPQPKATSTLDDIVAAKVDEAMAQAEQRITAQALAKVNKMNL